MFKIQNYASKILDVPKLLKIFHYLHLNCFHFPNIYFQHDKKKVMTKSGQRENKKL